MFTLLRVSTFYMQVQYAIKCRSLEDIYYQIYHSGGLTDFYHLNWTLDHQLKQAQLWFECLTDCREAKFFHTNWRKTLLCGAGYVSEARKKFPKLLSESWKVTYSSNVTAL